MNVGWLITFISFTAVNLCIVPTEALINNISIVADSRHGFLINRFGLDEGGYIVIDVNNFKVHSMPLSLAVLLGSELLTLKFLFLPALFSVTLIRDFFAALLIICTDTDRAQSKCSWINLTMVS